MALTSPLGPTTACKLSRLVPLPLGSPGALVGFHLHGGTLNKSLCVYGLFLFSPHALIDPFLHGGK